MLRKAWWPPPAGRRARTTFSTFGDTKKNLEAIDCCAKFARTIAKAQGEVSGIEEFLFEAYEDREAGKTRHIDLPHPLRQRVPGLRLVQPPGQHRGLRGHVVIDEAAFHGDVQGVLDAATALVIWAARCDPSVAHNGERPFAQFCAT